MRPRWIFERSGEETSPLQRYALDQFAGDVTAVLFNSLRKSPPAGTSLREDSGAASNSVLQC